MPTWPMPDPPNGVASVPSSDTNAQASLFYGEDVFFDVAAGLGADYVVTPAGDYLTVEGEAALKQRLLRRTITSPNEWRTRPGYGVGARDYIKAKDSNAMRSELGARIREQYLRERGVESVDQVVIEKVEASGIGPGLRINVQYTPRGRLRGDRPSTILIELR